MQGLQQAQDPASPQIEPAQMGQLVKQNHAQLGLVQLLQHRRRKQDASASDAGQRRRQHRPGDHHPRHPRNILLNAQSRQLFFDLDLSAMIPHRQPSHSTLKPDDQSEHRKKT